MYKIMECDAEARWKVVPAGLVRIKLEEVKKMYDVVVDGGIAVVVHDEKGEFVVKRTGEIRFKSERSKKETIQIADEVYSCRSKK